MQMKYSSKIMYLAMQIQLSALELFTLGYMDKSLFEKIWNQQRKYFI